MATVRNLVTSPKSLILAIVIGIAMLLTGGVANASANVTVGNALS